MMRQELESVDFYIAQGYADIAVDTLEMLERQFGPHPDIQARREKLAAARDQQPEAPAVFEFGGAEELSATPVPETMTFDADSCVCITRWRRMDGGNNVGTARQSQPELMRVSPSCLKSFVLLKKATTFRKITKLITTWARLTKRWISWTRPSRSFKLRRIW